MYAVRPEQFTKSLQREGHPQSDLRRSYFTQSFGWTFKIYTLNLNIKSEL